MTQRKKIIGLLYRQVCLLKKFKNTEHFWETLGLSKSTVYFGFLIQQCLQTIQKITLKELSLFSKKVGTSLSKFYFSK